MRKACLKPRASTLHFWWDTDFAAFHLITERALFPNGLVVAWEHLGYLIYGICTEDGFPMPGITGTAKNWLIAGTLPCSSVITYVDWVLTPNYLAIRKSVCKDSPSKRPVDFQCALQLIRVPGCGHLISINSLRLGSYNMKMSLVLQSNRGYGPVALHY